MQQKKKSSASSRNYRRVDSTCIVPPGRSSDPRKSSDQREDPGNNQFERSGIDADGAFFKVPIKNDTQPVNFIVHLPGRDDVPTGREPGGDRSFIPIDHPEIWLKQGDPTVYFNKP